jgi:hypothetical protein
MRNWYGSVRYGKGKTADCRVGAQIVSQDDQSASRFASGAPQNRHPERSASAMRFAQDDDILGILTKNIQNKLAPMGLRPPLLNMDITRASFSLDRGTAAIDGSVDVVLVRGAVRCHGERRIRLDRSRAGVGIQREMGITQAQ